MTAQTKLATHGAGIERSRHVSLMDCARTLHAAGVENPGNADPIRSWRSYDEEVANRIWRTSLYAVRDAVPEAPDRPSVEPPDVDIHFEYRQRRARRPEQVSLGDFAGGVGGD